MRRSMWFVPVPLALVVGAALWLRPGHAPAEPAAAESFVAPVGKAAPTLRVMRVVLFSSGVGYFQREGSVDGDTRVDLSFPVHDVNDLLKSLVLQDLDGGQVSAVSYDSNAPAEKALKS